jgi:hypothetical protein
MANDPPWLDSVKLKRIHDKTKKLTLLAKRERLTKTLKSVHSRGAERLYGK